MFAVRIMAVVSLLVLGLGWANAAEVGRSFGSDADGAVRAEGRRTQGGDHKQAGKVLRVGGRYKIVQVERHDRGGFKIVFRSIEPTGRFDELILDTVHVHMAVATGQTVRLSAEISKDRGMRAEVSQVVLFLPSAQGPTPVWLLSRTSQPRDLTATRYIDMHVPQSDYLVF